MSGDELRGVGQYVGSNYYLTVYGDLPVDISFVVQNTATGQAFTASEHLTFYEDVVGSRKQPFAITIASPTGISDIPAGRVSTAVYDLQGRKVNTLPRKGVYIVNGHKVVNGKYINK